MATKSNRCWPGYEPVKGKPEHSQGSCRKKAASKQTAGEKKFVSQREKQLEKWKKEHPGSSPKAAQHLHAPGAKKRASPRKRIKKT